MKREMKEWIRNLNDEDFYSLVLDSKTGLDGLGIEIERKIKDEFRDFRQPKYTFGKFFKPAYLIRFGIAAAFVLVLTGSLIAVLTFGGRIKAYPVLVAGKISAQRDGEIITRDWSSPHEGGETILTGDSSSYVLVAGGAIVKMSEHTGMRLEKLDGDEISIYLDYGEILCDSGGDLRTSFIITTSSSICRFAGVALVRYSADNTYIAMLEGDSTIEPEMTAGEKISIGQGESASIGKDNLPVKTAIAVTEKDALGRFSDFNGIMKHSGGSRVTINTDESGVSLFIDGVEVGVFDLSISFSLDQGSHGIILEKEGCVPFELTDRYLKGRSYAIEATLVRMEPDASIGLSFGTAMEIYRYKNPESETDSMILGFAGTGDRIIAVSRTRLTCFDAWGKKLWERNFGSTMRIVFESLPYCVSNRLFVPAIYKLLVVNINDGTYTSFDAPGIISDGFGIAFHKGMLYLPYPDGVYTVAAMSPGQPSAFIAFQNPVEPLPTIDGLYVLSYITPEVALYSFDGTLLWSEPMGVRSLCPPVKHGDYVAVGDSVGTVAIFTGKRERIEIARLDSPIVDLAGYSGKFLFALTADGALHQIDTRDFRTKKRFIDEKPEPGLYLFKRIGLIGNDLVIGANSGELLVIDANTFDLRFSGAAGSGPVSCSVFAGNGALFSGSKGGVIFRIPFTD